MSFRKTILLILMIAILMTPIFALSEKTVSIIVKEVKVFATPSSFGKVVATLKYTNSVTVLEENAGWIKISFTGGKQGWIHSSAVSSGNTKITAGKSDKNTGASSDEVALAGKGFNKEVEAKYKQENVKIDFTWVDRMETYKVSTEDIMTFLTKGSLSAAGGTK